MANKYYRTSKLFLGKGDPAITYYSWMESIILHVQPVVYENICLTIKFYTHNQL